MALLSPMAVARHLSDLRQVVRGGGPAALSLLRVGEPHGLILPRSEVVVEVETRSGRKVRLDPEVPLPFLLGWTIRIARGLNVPIVSSLDPETFSFSFRLPGG